MERGDIVIGKPLPRKGQTGAPSVFFANSCKGYEEDWITSFTVYSHKEDYLIRTVPGSHMFDELRKNAADFTHKIINFDEVKGMVVDFDPLGEKRPHIDGIAAVLIEDKIWWIVAKHLQVIKLGQG